MNNLKLMNVPSEECLLCFVNYHVFPLIKTEGNCFDLKLLKAPITASNLKEARIKLANIFRVPVDAMTQWEEVGKEDGFASSLRIGFDTGLKSAGYFFDVYITVNTLALLEDNRRLVTETEQNYNKNMNSIQDIPASEFNMKNLLDLRYDKERGVVKIYQIRGKLIVDDRNGRRFL